MHPVARKVPEDRGGHLRPTGILHADEQHLGRFGERLLPGCKGGEPVAGESRGQRGKVPGDARLLGEQVAALAYVPLHRFDAEHAGESVGEVSADALQQRIVDLCRRLLQQFGDPVDVFGSDRVPDLPPLGLAGSTPSSRSAFA